MYNYLKNVREDVRNYIDENINLKDYTKEELEEKLNDDLWIEDSVTGNGSGSYTFSTYEAEKNLVGNFELLREALSEFGQSGVDVLEKGAEWCDVTIRCYLLGRAIADVLEEYREECFAE